MKYAVELRTQLRRMFKGPIRVLAIGVTPRRFELTHICGADLATRALIESMFSKWFNNFQEKVKSSRMNLEQAPSAAPTIVPEKANLKRSFSQLTLDSYLASDARDDIPT